MMIRTAGFGLAAVSLLGCSSGDVAGSPIDAAGGEEIADADAPGEPDACEVAHGETCGGVWEERAEGGEIRVETREVAAGGAEAIHAAEAFFFRDQVPARRPIGGELVLGGEDREGTLCWDKRPEATWNGGARTESQEIYETRTYLDAGESVRLVPVDASHDEIALEKVEGNGGAEAFDVTSRAQGLEHPFLYQSPHDPLADYASTEASFELGVGAMFRPVIAGGEGVAELDVSDGWSLVDDGGLEEFYLYVPARFDMVRPAEAAFTGDPADAERPIFAMAKGADFQFEIEGHEPFDAIPEGAPAATIFLTVTGDEGLDFFCLQKDPLATTITLPAEVLDEVLEQGTMAVGRIAVAWWVHGGRHLYLVGATSKLGSYCIDEPGVEPGSDASCASGADAGG